MFPVTLTEDEILTLRLMLRTVISRRTLEACSEYKLKLKALKENESTDPVDMGFVQKTLLIQDTYRNLDIILYQAEKTAAAKKDTVVIALGPSQFGSLKACAHFKYYTDNVSDAASLETADRIVRHQDSIKRAFENSEAQLRDIARPNHPVPTGFLN